MNCFIKRWTMGSFCDDQLIFPSVIDNRAVFVNVTSGQVTFGPELFHENKKNKQWNYSYYSSAIYIGKNKILFVPHNQKNFLLFNLKNQNQKMFEINLSDYSGEGEQYWEFIVYKNNLILFPSCANNILQIDLETMSVTKYENVIRDIELITGKRGQICLDSKAQYGKNILLLAGWYDNFVVKIDLSTMDYQVIMLENEMGEKGFRNIEIFGNFIYIVNHKYHVLKYTMDKFQLLKKVNVLTKCSIVKKTNAGLCFVPAFEEDFIICDSDENQIRRIPFFKKYCFLTNDEKYNCNNYVIESNCYYFVMRSFGNTVIKIDKVTGQVYYIPLKYDRSVMRYIYNQKKIYIEGEGIVNNNGINIKTDLNNFIYNIEKRNKKYNKNNLTGRKIYIHC